jgi:hypothetical protein
LNVEEQSYPPAQEPRKPRGLRLVVILVAALILVGILTAVLYQQAQQPVGLPSYPAAFDVTKTLTLPAGCGGSGIGSGSDSLTEWVGSGSSTSLTLTWSVSGGPVTISAVASGGSPGFAKTVNNSGTDILAGSGPFLVEALLQIQAIPGCPAQSATVTLQGASA